MKYYFLLTFFNLLISLIMSLQTTLTDFEYFLSNFNIKIDKSEYLFRKNIFDSEIENIKNHNTNFYLGTTSWLKTINHMSIMTNKEKKSFIGYNKDIKKNYKPLYKLNDKLNDKSLYKSLYKPKFLFSSESESVDWSSIRDITSAVKDQGQCGSCWAFASTAVIESHVAINTGKLFDLSPQQIAACAPNPNQCGGAGNCQGSTAELAFDYVASISQLNSGLAEEFQYPYLSYYGIEQNCTNLRSAPKAKISGYVKLPENNYTALVDAVTKIGPIAISVDASNWHSYSSGIFNDCNQVNPNINHAVVLTGYGTDKDTGLKYWLIRNSWSASWGENGYIRILRSDDEDNNCGYDITPQEGTACAGDTTPQKVCGTCGILFDSAYPVDATIF
jgi:cathepsin L